MSIGKLGELLATAAIGAFLLFCAYTFFVWMPVSLLAEGKCLEAGYPKHHVTVGLEVYCTTIDGAVSARVVKP